MFTQFVFLTAAAFGSAVGSVTLQQPGVLQAVTYNMFPFITLGAGDEFAAEIELSLNNVLAAASQMSPPNGVICKDTCSVACDIAGTSIAYLNPAKSHLPVAPRAMVAGQILYVNIGQLIARAGANGVFYGYLALHFR